MKKQINHPSLISPKGRRLGDFFRMDKSQKQGLMQGGNAIKRTLIIFPALFINFIVFSQIKFFPNWVHLDTIYTKDAGNVNPNLAQYGTLYPENFHPLGVQSDPCVRMYNDTFKIWYNSNQFPPQGQAYTYSVDGILFEDPKNYNTMVNLVLVPDPGEIYETPNVMKHPQTGDYYLYSSAKTSGDWYIKLATSQDGVTWAKYPNAVLTKSYSWEEAGVLEPSVIYDETSQIFKMWYASWGTYQAKWQGYIGYATSTDGINWQKNPLPVFLASTTGWDSEMVAHEEVIKDTLGGYHMFFVGTSSISQQGLYGLGHAYSTDGINWQRDTNNPIITRQPATWYSGMLGGPTALFYNNKVYLYYFGGLLDQVWQDVHFGLSTADLLATNIHSIETLSSVIVYPNLSMGDFLIEINALTNEESTLKVTDVMGKVVYNETVLLSKGKNIRTVSLAKESQGVFFMQVIFEKGVKHIPVVIMK